MPDRAAGVFKFKQFSVDQSGCAMKINTDGVLLGALATAEHAVNILDIGTGTGVIAMMLAQRFKTAFIDAVEIDLPAAQTAEKNFKGSSFAERLSIYAADFQQFFESEPQKRYDLIVSNPPFFLNSLESPGARKNLARHTDEKFFEQLIEGVSRYLTPHGHCELILPLATAGIVKSHISHNRMFIQKLVRIRSFANDEPHREIISFGPDDSKLIEDDFVIYNKPKFYTAAYEEKMRAFFTIFE